MKNLISSAKGAFLTAGAFIGSSAMAAEVADKASAIGTAFFTKSNTDLIGNVLVGVGVLVLLGAVFMFVSKNDNWKKIAGTGAFLALSGAAFQPIIEAVGITVGA